MRVALLLLLAGNGRIDKGDPRDQNFLMPSGGSSSMIFDLCYSDTQDGVPLGTRFKTDLEYLKLQDTRTNYSRDR